MSLARALALLSIPVGTIILLVVLTLYHDRRPAPSHVKVMVPKTVAAKQERIASSYGMNPWRAVSDKESFTRVEVSTVYVLVFTDGTEERVPGATYAATEVGATYQVAEWVPQTRRVEP